MKKAKVPIGKIIGTIIEKKSVIVKTEMAIEFRNPKS